MNINTTKIVEHKSVVPVSVQSDWVQLSTDPSTEDNAGSDITAANAISRWDTIDGGTTLMLMLRYDDGLSSITDPVVQVFGRGTTDPNKRYGASDANSKPVCHKLRNSSGTHAITLTTSSSDLTDGTYKYTTPIEVDMDASAEILVGIKTALAGTGTVDNSKILVKVK